MLRRRFRVLATWVRSNRDASAQAVEVAFGTGYFGSSFEEAMEVHRRVRELRDDETKMPCAI